MAKSKQTFNKREKEKQRQKQQQEKRQKAEEKRAGKQNGKSPGSMMAYVDEDGNLSDTPPDPARRQSIALEDIQIGVQKQDKTVQSRIKTGTISFYNKAKGFGFINETGSNERIFFHVNDTHEPLEESDTVTFQSERGPRGFIATQVTKLV